MHLRGGLPIFCIVRSHAKFKNTTVAQPVEFLYLIRSTDGMMISKDLHNECQGEQDGVVVY